VPKYWRQKAKWTALSVTLPDWLNEQGAEWQVVAFDLDAK